MDASDGKGDGKGDGVNPAAGVGDEVTHVVPVPNVQSPRLRRRGIYLLPNLFTTGALFCGFYAITASIAGRYEVAAIAIFVAMLLDGLDGRVARMTDTQTSFGAEYDSLSDMVAFGVAPSLLAYNSLLSTLGKVGWVVAFIYTSCAALRLARFNVQAASSNKKYFIGLPSPSAAAVVTSMIWVIVDAQLDFNRILAVCAAILTAFSAVMMVSNVKFHSFKQVDLRGKVPFMVILAAMLLFAAISLDPPKVFFLIFLAYAVFTPALALKRFVFSRNINVISK
jgi:CDP-diacylglycerol---serine O-phosphatidyltransferase